jgi:hypothetical protein
MRRIYQPSYRLKRRNVLSLLALRYRRRLIQVENAIDIGIGFVKDMLYRAELTAQPGVVATPLKPQGPQRPPSDAGDQRRWCLFASYSPKSVVTDMVLEQLRAYKEAGFNVVFITMSRTLSKGDEAKLARFCAYVIHRRSFGRDFGAWAHAAQLLAAELAGAEALLLTNDSNLGPIYPLRPWIEDCLKRHGVFGLTESLGGGSHLQSFFLVGNGADAVAAMLAFLKEMKPSHSKWLMIQRGEIAFTQEMQKKGLFVGACIGHEDVESVLLGDELLQAELAVLFPGVFIDLENPPIPDVEGAWLDEKIEYFKLKNRYLLRSKLFVFPVNPTHQLASVLVKHFKFPFIKAELVVKNPCMVPSAPDWRYFVTAESPVSEEMIENHLVTLV